MYIIFYFLIFFKYSYVKSDTPCPKLLEDIEFNNDLSGKYTLAVNLSMSKAIDTQTVRLVPKISMWQVMKGGKLRFYVSFPFNHTLPLLTAVTFNHKLYCTGPGEEGHNVVVLDKTITQVIDGWKVNKSDDPLSGRTKGTLQILAKSRSEAVARAQAEGQDLAKARNEVAAQAAVVAQSQVNVRALAIARSQAAINLIVSAKAFSGPSTRFQENTYLFLDHRNKLARSEFEMLTKAEDQVKAMARSEAEILEQAKNRVLIKSRSEDAARSYAEALASIEDQSQTSARSYSEIVILADLMEEMESGLENAVRLENEARVAVRFQSEDTTKIDKYLEECGTDDDYQPFIVGGESTKDENYPWLVAIFTYHTKYNFQCAGNLISDRHVLTAAHCLKGKNVTELNSLLIVMGVRNLKDWDSHSTTRGMKSYAIHEDFKKPADADVAVITMKEPVELLPTIKPICLWSDSNRLEWIVGQTGVVVGWGRNETVTPHVMEHKKVQMPIVSQRQCLWSHPGFYYLTSERTFCAGDRNGSTPCTGDSGGGFFMKRNSRWILRGLVSIGVHGQRYGTCNGYQYTVYSDVSQFYDWITEFMRNS